MHEFKVLREQSDIAKSDDSDHNVELQCLLREKFELKDHDHPKQ